VTLYTGRGLSQWIWTSDQQGPGQPGTEKISIYFNVLLAWTENGGELRAASFLPGGKFCRPLHAKAARVIASREYGLY
jgi:hypothetical protein